jgi:hypothetical protein
MKVLSIQGTEHRIPGIEVIKVIGGQPTASAQTIREGQGGHMETKRR